MATGAAPSQDRLGDLRRTSPFADEEDFVGFHEDVKLLEAQLTSSEKGRSVISIMGMDGLGKTSLARKLYNTNKYKFELHAWICVSLEWNTKDLLARIINSLNKKGPYDELKMLKKMNNTDDMKRYLHELLKDKVYLLLIDDMWDEEALEFLKSALPDNQNQSRVIITTRNEFVAELSDQNHKLRHLQADESWELFCKNSFSNQNGVCPHDLEKVGKEMVEKCDGVPLAIIVMGGLLSRKQSNEWHAIKTHIWRALLDTSIHISALLELSYNDLSQELKYCFLYLGIFPEDCEIGTDKLVQLWIAEDLIPQSEGVVLTELAGSYIKELSVRSLIQLITTADTLNPTYRVHGLLRDLAVNNAKELDFFHIYEESMNPAIVPLSTKRIAFRSGFESYMATIDDHSHPEVCTISFINYYGVLDDGDVTKLLAFINKRSKSLRVLDLDGVRIVSAQSKLKLFESMEKLVDVKSWGLSQMDIDMLSESVGNLQALQEEHFIGLVDDVKLLETQLFSSELTRCVVSILGRGGTGKTTLARKLYHTHMNSFELHAWVCVPREWNAKYLLRRIINSFKELTTDNLSNSVKMKDEDDIKRYLNDLLKDKRYLLVIDDIWDKEIWECLKSALPDNQNGSRVIITSRNELVAELSNQRTYVHKLRRLRADESWELFCTKAFANQNFTCSQDLEEIGKRMVKMCGGLPLAIILLGGFLSRKQSNEWHVLEDHIWIALFNTSDEIFHLLDLIYNDMSRELKSCFLYLGIFSEDNEIDKEKLVRMWIDDGFIPQSKGQDQDELAESYINELNARCLIQLIRRSNDSSTSICRVHDLLRDFAFENAKELPFFYAGDATKPTSTSRIARHLGFRPKRKRINYFTLMRKAEYTAREARMKISLLGTAVSDLLEAVKEAKKNISTFKPIFESLEATLTTITPCLKEIILLNPKPIFETDFSADLKPKTYSSTDLDVLIRDGKKIIHLNPKPISETDISTDLIPKTYSSTGRNLDVLIRDGKELVFEYSEIARRNVDKKYQYLIRLCNLDSDLSRYFVSVLQVVDQYREIEKVQVVLSELRLQRSMLNKRIPRKGVFD